MTNPCLVLGPLTLAHLNLTCKPKREVVVIEGKGPKTCDKRGSSFVICCHSHMSTATLETLSGKQPQWTRLPSTPTSPAPKLPHSPSHSPPIVVKCADIISWFIANFVVNCLLARQIHKQNFTRVYIKVQLPLSCPPSSHSTSLC